MPPIKVVEHHRSIRDGTEIILAGDLSALDLEPLQRMFKGKPGPGGGFDFDAYGCAFFLAAFLVDSRRHAIFGGSGGPAIQADTQAQYNGAPRERP